MSDRAPELRDKGALRHVVLELHDEPAGSGTVKALDRAQGGGPSEDGRDGKCERDE